jgi:phosphate uptake regulator
MNVQRPSKVMHSHLLKMTMLSQKAVDYSIKSYEWKSLEFCKAVLNAEAEWAEVQREIGDQGRTFRAAGRPIDFDSPFAGCALRIFGALRVTYAAATQIARHTMLMLESGRLAPSSEIREMGDHVNSLVRLYTVALFKKNAEHAATILQNAKVRDWFYPRIYPLQNDVCQGNGATVQLEFEIVRSLAQIAEQALEIGEAIMRWLEGNDCRGLPRKRSGQLKRIHIYDLTPVRLASPPLSSPAAGF